MNPDDGGAHLVHFDTPKGGGVFSVGFNTMRFNEQRRKLQHDDDAIDLLVKNIQVAEDLLRAVVKESTFDSLKNFVTEILTSKASFEDKYE